MFSPYLDEKDRFMEFYFIVFAIILFAAVIQGAAGFGFGLVAVSLLSMFVNIKDASLILLLSGIALNLFIFSRLYKEFCFDQIIPIFISSLVCVPIGVYILEKADCSVLKYMLGVILILMVIQRLTPALKEHKWHPYWLGIPCGICTGILAGSLGAAGPPVVAFVASQKFKKFHYSACVQFIFVNCCFVRLFFVIEKGLMTKQILITGAVGVLFVIIGAFIGLKIMKKMSEKILGYIITVMLFAFGIKYLFL